MSHILKQHEQHLHAQVVDMPDHEEDLTNAHLYAKSKLGEDILITVIIDKKEENTLIDYVVKANDKGIVNLICQRIRELKI